MSYSGDIVLATKLATVTGVNGKTTGATNLYTVPTGKTLILLSVVPRVTAADTVTVPPIIQIGKTPAFTEWLATGTLTGATAVGKLFNLGNFVATTVASTFAAGEIVAVNFTTGATATTLTVAFDVIGYLV